MGAKEWRAPSKFYIKYEAKHLPHEIEELQAEYEYLLELKKYMIKEGLYKEETKSENMGETKEKSK